MRCRVCLSRPSVDSSNGGRRVCCRALCGQEISIDSCRRPAATAPRHGAQQQIRAASRHVHSRRRRLSTAWLLQIGLCLDPYKSGCTNRDSVGVWTPVGPLTTRVLARWGQYPPEKGAILNCRCIWQPMQHVYVPI